MRPWIQWKTKDSVTQKRYNTQDWKFLWHNSKWINLSPFHFHSGFKMTKALKVVNITFYYVLNKSCWIEHNGTFYRTSKLDFFQFMPIEYLNFCKTSICMLSPSIWPCIPFVLVIKPINKSHLDAFFLRFRPRYIH